MRLKTSVFLGVLALTIATQPRSVYGMMREELEPSQSLSPSHTPKSATDFEDYFNKVIGYGVDSFGGEESIIFCGIEDTKKTKAQNKELILQNLIELAPSLSHFYRKMENSDSTYLEILFRENLGWMAKEICVKINETKEQLPEKYEVLLKISQGDNLENDFHIYSTDFINLAYKVANNAKNINMVNKLFLHSDVKEKAENLKISNPLIYLNYIHEPYWSYNLIQLHEYGGRIIEKIKPYFVNKDRVKTKETGRYFCDFMEEWVVREETYVCSDKESITVREVPFGYVLPNLYLKERVDMENDKFRAVTRIFVVPKNDSVKFTFRMPYTNHLCKGKNVFDCINTGNNAMQVLSEDFVVYQEWIDGSGYRGNREFESWGHRDFDKVQIIKSNKDKKSYLVDTKEKKNFFAPCFSPFCYDYDYTLLEYHIKAGITDNDTYSSWKKASQAVVYDAKNLHFDPRVIFVDVTVQLEH